MCSINTWCISCIHSATAHIRNEEFTVGLLPANTRDERVRMWRTCDAIKTTSMCTMMLVMIAIDKKEFCRLLLLLRQCCGVFVTFRAIATNCHVYAADIHWQIWNFKEIRDFFFNFSELSFLCLASVSPLLCSHSAGRTLASSLSCIVIVGLMPRCLHAKNRFDMDTMTCPIRKENVAFVLPMALNCCRRSVLWTMHPNVVALSRPSASELRWFLFIFALFNTPILLQRS